MPQTDMSPSTAPYLITPADTGALSPAIRSFSVAVAGNVSVIRLDGVTETWAVPAGVFPAAVRQIRATGTTATGFVGLP